jgi:hypothetical protein
LRIRIYVGYYGFGFTDDGKLNIFDLGVNQLLSVQATNDKKYVRRTADADERG